MYAAYSNRNAPSPAADLLLCHNLFACFFADKNFLGIAFDSGGVTTGPMTVPFILALGLGVSNVRSDKNAEADSFGLVALCSIGPVLAVLILGFSTRTMPPLQILALLLMARPQILDMPFFMLFHII